jgi:hypothetical protein
LKKAAKYLVFIGNPLSELGLISAMENSKSEAITKNGVNIFFSGSRLTVDCQ